MWLSFVLPILLKMNDSFFDFLVAVISSRISSQRSNPRTDLYKKLETL